jgi:hypothetical protein
MARKTSPSTLRSSWASPETSYEFPSSDSPEPSPAIQEPGRPPAKNRAPGGSGGVPVWLPGPGQRLRPDDRLARPETGEEYIDGECMQAMSGDAAHADPQCDLNYAVRACVAKRYVASTELLTRTDVGSDFTTDVCVRKRGIDPKTGGRYMEEVSFEVAHTQTREDLERKRIPKLLAAGVRRVIAVLIPEGDVLEWSQKGGGKWKGLPPDSYIRDRVFKTPLHVKAILDATATEKLVSQAQIAKREPHLMEVLDEHEAKGRTEGLAEAILLAFESRGVTLDAPNRQEIQGCQDTELLRNLLIKTLAASSASEILAELEKIS